MVKTKGKWIGSILLFSMALVIALCLQPHVAFATGDGDGTVVPAQNVSMEEGVYAEEDDAAKTAEDAPVEEGVCAEGDAAGEATEDANAEDYYDAFRDQDIEYSEAIESSGSTGYYLVIPDPGTTTTEITPDEPGTRTVRNTPDDPAETAEEPPGVSEIAEELPQTGDGLWMPIICLGIAAACACGAIVLSARANHIRVPRGSAKKANSRSSNDS